MIRASACTAIAASATPCRRIAVVSRRWSAWTTAPAGAGGARIRVLADGKPLDIGADRELTAAGGPLAVRVDVAGAKELTLEVDFGKDGPVQGCVDWVDARFVK